MGASSWHYYTPYRSDPETALQELRRDVFARREFSMGFGGVAGATRHPAAVTGGMTGAAARLFSSANSMPGPEGRILRAAISGDFSDLSASERQMVEQFRPLIQMAQTSGAELGLFAGEDECEEEEDLAALTQPATIETLLELAGEEGTHSILDIEHTGPQLGFSVAAPLPAALLARAFGGARPMREQVEAHWATVADRLERWQAYYLTVYRDDAPHEYAFIGCSGD